MSFYHSAGINNNTYEHILISIFKFKITETVRSAYILSKFETVLSCFSLVQQWMQLLNHSIQGGEVGPLLKLDAMRFTLIQMNISLTGQLPIVLSVILPELFLHLQIRVFAILHVLSTNPRFTLIYFDEMLSRRDTLYLLKGEVEHVRRKRYFFKERLY